MDAAFLPVESVLQIGASEGQKHFDSRATGSSPCFYVEPIWNAFEILRQNLELMPGHHAVKAACSDAEGASVNFSVASNSGLSSSLLNLGLHACLYPGVTFMGLETMETTTVDRLIEVHGACRVPNLWAIDTQGADLHVLRGARVSLPFVAASSSKPA